MYYIVVFLFLIGGYWMYSGVRGSNVGLIQVAAITLFAAVGTLFATVAAFSTLNL